ASHVQPIPLFHLPLLFSVFFFNAPAPTEIYTLSLHDALPISAMILRFGTDDQKRRWVPRLVRGDIKGAVAMTEPQAGSDVGNLQTIARQDGGTWRLTGRKQFISAGNGEFVIVLARAVPDSRGLDGLALFVVEREGDNYVVERAEHKFPIRGSCTCSLVFDGSRAELRGEVGGGW